jgi:hypothetical protein
LGAALEERGFVEIAPIGNAVCRTFRARDAFRLGVELFREDPNLFTRVDDTFTVLADGVVIDREKSVVDADALYKKVNPGQ